MRCSVYWDPQDWMLIRKQKRQWEQKKVSFASREEAEKVTNQIYGGISPLGLPDNLKIFIDENVMNREKLFIGAGNRVSKFFLTWVVGWTY